MSFNRQLCISPRYLFESAKVLQSRKLRRVCCLAAESQTLEITEQSWDLRDIETVDFQIDGAFDDFVL